MSVCVCLPREMNRTSVRSVGTRYWKWERIFIRNGDFRIFVRASQSHLHATVFFHKVVLLTLTMALPYPCFAYENTAKYFPCDRTCVYVSTVCIIVAALCLGTLRLAFSQLVIRSFPLRLVSRSASFEFIFLAGIAIISTTKYIPLTDVTRCAKQSSVSVCERTNANTLCIHFFCSKSVSVS